MATTLGTSSQEKSDGRDDAKGTQDRERDES